MCVNVWYLAPHALDKGAGDAVLVRVRPGHGDLDGEVQQRLDPRGGYLAVVGVGAGVGGCVWVWVWVWVCKGGGGVH